MPADRLRELLDEEDVAYTTMEHRHAYTAQQVAEAEHISGYEFAKPVLLLVNGDLVMAVVPGPAGVDLDAVGRIFDTTDVRLATEDEFGPRFADSELGAEPPFGNLYGIPTVVDRHLADLPSVTVRDGTHEGTITLAASDYLRLSGAVMADIAVVDLEEHRRVVPRGEPPPEGAWLRP